MVREKLLTVREVARKCRRSEETVRRWIWSGKLAARKLGNQLFVSSDEVRRLSLRGVSADSSRDPQVTKKALLKQIDEDERFAEGLRAKYGVIDVVELVRQAREEDV